MMFTYTEIMSQLRLQLVGEFMGSLAALIWNRRWNK